PDGRVARNGRHPPSPAFRRPPRSPPQRVVLHSFAFFLPRLPLETGLGSELDRICHHHGYLTSMSPRRLEKFIIARRQAVTAARLGRCNVVGIELREPQFTQFECPLLEGFAMWDPNVGLV